MIQHPNRKPEPEQNGGASGLPCRMETETLRYAADGSSGSPGAGFGSLRRAAEQGDAEAQFHLAERHYKRYDEGGVEKDLKEAVKWYQASAGRGNAGAQFEIGWLYYEGKGVESDSEKAVKWYRLAAEQGYDKAQYWLGWCFRYGIGVGRNMDEAVTWCRLAAEQGNEDALEDLVDLESDVSGRESGALTAL